MLQDLKDLLPFVNAISIVSLSMFFVFAFIKGWIVRGSEVDYERAEKQRAQERADEYLQLAQRGTGQASEMIEMVRLFAEMNKDK